MTSPLSKTSVYPDHVQTPAFLKRYVFVNAPLGAICEPSGIFTSFTNAAWSQTAVGEAAGGSVEAGSVGKDTDVFVAAGGGRVGVLNGAA